MNLKKETLSQRWDEPHFTHQKQTLAKSRYSTWELQRKQENLTCVYLCWLSINLCRWGKKLSIFAGGHFTIFLLFCLDTILQASKESQYRVVKCKAKQSSKQNFKGNQIASFSVLLLHKYRNIYKGRCWPVEWVHFSRLGMDCLFG